MAFSVQMATACFNALLVYSEKQVLSMGPVVTGTGEVPQEAEKRPVRMTKQKRWINVKFV